MTTEEEGLPELHIKIQQALQEHPMTQRFGIVVKNDAGVVVLVGTVRSFYAKQMAQEVIRPLLGATVLRNKIEVISNNS